jgi:hypothetical protein
VSDNVRMQCSRHWLLFQWQVAGGKQVQCTCSYRHQELAVVCIWVLCEFWVKGVDTHTRLVCNA